MPILGRARTAAGVAIATFGVLAPPTLGAHVHAAGASSTSAAVSTPDRPGAGTAARDLSMPGDQAPTNPATSTGFAPGDGLVGTASVPMRDVAAAKRRHESLRPRDARAPGFPSSVLSGRGQMQPEAPLPEPRELATSTPAPSATPTSWTTTVGPRPTEPLPAPSRTRYRILSGYAMAPTELVDIASGARPYESTTVTPVEGFGLRDAQNVRMFSFSGSTVRWNHPVGQAQYALANLNSHRLTGDPRYLDIALANARRLVDRRVASADAWYYPYDFDFAVFGDTANTNHAPWYSAMAQGQALSVFVRLAEVTGDPRWTEAAHRTFLTLQQAPVRGAPFVSWVDSAAQLWLEEYPRYPHTSSERVLNGHLFAVFGLLDYLRLVGQRPEVVDLTRGALVTAKQTTSTQFRRPDWASAYSLFHGRPSPGYHPIHVDQFVDVWKATRDPVWIRRASLYRRDFPDKNASGQVVITPRTRTIHRLDSGYRIVETRTISVSSTTGAPASQRHRIVNGPVALKISAGRYDGWWIPEARGVTWLRGATDTHVYVPAATVVLAAGRTFSAYRLGDTGLVSGHKTVTVGSSAMSAPSGASAIVEGRPALRIDAGVLAGYWLPEQAGVTVAAP